MTRAVLHIHTISTTIRTTVDYRIDITIIQLTDMLYLQTASPDQLIPRRARGGRGRKRVQCVSNSCDVLLFVM
jgi:hypothetical protein